MTWCDSIRWSPDRNHKPYAIAATRITRNSPTKTATENSATGKNTRLAATIPTWRSQFLGWRDPGPLRLPLVIWPARLLMIKRNIFFSLAITSAMYYIVHYLESFYTSGLRYAQVFLKSFPSDTLTSGTKIMRYVRNAHSLKSVCDFELKNGSGFYL